MYTDQQYKELYDLNEYQIKAIKKRMSLDFDKELFAKSEEKSILSKSIRNNLDVIIEKFIDKGIIFYFFTFNFLEKSSDWETINRRVEETITFAAKHISMIEFIYLSIEKHGISCIKEKNVKVKPNNKIKSLDIISSKYGKPHFHCVIGTRTMISGSILSDIRDIFNQFNDDTKISVAKDFKNVKKAWNYVIKENNFKFHRFVYFSKFHTELYGSLSQLEDTFNNVLDYGLGYYDCGLHNHIPGINLNNPDDEIKIMYILNLYFLKKGYFLSKNEIYTKIENSRFSWRIFDSIKYINNNISEILLEMQLEFSAQLQKLKINQIISKSWDQVYNKIRERNKYLPVIEFNPAIIEFKDGLYFLDHNYFLDFYRENKSLLDKISINCYKYFDKSYSFCKLNPPEYWLSAIKRTLLEKTEDFCADLGRYFHSQILLDEKKKTLCIKGDSSTGKTALIANIITQFVGLNNIGKIGKGDIFAFEQIEDKKLIICDEFKYKEEIREELINIMDNQPFLPERKYQVKSLYVNKAPIMFLFNEKINDKMLEDDAFRNRLLIYTFTYKVAKKDLSQDIKKHLEQELPQIMIYCNDLYFKKKNPYNLQNYQDVKYKKKYILKHLNLLTDK